MKKFLIGILTMVLLGTGISQADGNKKGFVIGLGVGSSLTSYTQSVPTRSYTSERENNFGLATDFKIGYGLNEKLVLVYTSKVSWFDFDNGEKENVTVTNGVGGIGAIYYLNRLYVTGGIGFSSWATPFEEKTDAANGAGFFLGCGYEFIAHLSVELGVTIGKSKMKFKGVGIDTDAVSIGMTVNYLIY